jgi:hypothetical protein
MCRLVPRLYSFVSVSWSSGTCNFFAASMDVKAPPLGLPRSAPPERPDPSVRHETSNEQHARHYSRQWRAQLRNNVLLHFLMPPKPRP